MSSEAERIDDADRSELATRLGEAFGDLAPDLVTRCRDYLKLIAQQSIDGGLQAKLSSSDVVQETLLQAWRKRDQFRGTSESEFYAWLYQILQNQLIDQQRRFRGSAKRDIRLERPLGPSPSGSGGVREVAESGHSPLSHAELAEESHRLSAAMESLSEDHQRVLRLRNWEGLDFVEIGNRMDRTPAAVRQLWVRALAGLQRALERQDDG